MGKIQLEKRSNRTGVLSSAKSGELKNVDFFQSKIAYSMNERLQVLLF